MFSLKIFILRGLLDAVGKQPDFWVILNAANWAEKGVLAEADLERIQAAIDLRSGEYPPDDAGNETDAVDDGETENASDGADGGETENASDSSDSTENTGETDPPAADNETGGGGE